MPGRSRRWKAAALVLAGMLAGTLLVQPVGAHFTQNTKHLGRHAWHQFIKERVFTRHQANNRFYTKSQIDRGATGCRGVAPDDVMVKVGGICIDAYEASLWTKKNGGTQITGTIPCAANGQNCKGKIFARSVAGVEPRHTITWFQALAALTNSGKRLPTSAEWQMAAQGTPDPGFNSAPPGCRTAGGSAVPTGSHSACKSAWGAFDMIGNLGEWVADWDEVAADCQNWSSDFGSDATCIGRHGADAVNRFPGALIRGGSVGSGSAAGVFAVNGLSQPSGSGNAIGFRGAR